MINNLNKIVNDENDSENSEDKLKFRKKFTRKITMRNKTIKEENLKLDE